MGPGLGCLGLGQMSDEVQKERTKLTATYWNGLAIVMTGGGVVALPIALANQPGHSWVFDYAAPLLIIGGILIHCLALWHLRGLRPKVNADAQ